MILPKVTDLDVSGKKVLVRADLDVDMSDNVEDLRLTACIPTLNYLKEHGAEIIILGHKGRPEGKVVESLSLRQFQPYFDKWGAKVEENLRFDPGEEENDFEYAKKIASLGEVYVNEAFAVSHREHASIVGIPKILPHAAGFRFIKEVETLGAVLEKPQKPILLIISGIKEDKVQMAIDLAKKFDKVLVGGKLPDYFENINFDKEKILVGALTFDGFDITLNTIERFKKEIAKAKTIILAGVLGKYEEEGYRQGTKEVFDAVSESYAFKIAGGGDTEAALSIFDLTEKFDWISVGGGAMLEFLAKETLPGIKALTQKNEPVS